ncbi:hypothetical protein EJD97_001716, partial [Solanum chilense]
TVILHIKVCNISYLRCITNIKIERIYIVEEKIKKKIIKTHLKFHFPFPFASFICKSSCVFHFLHELARDSSNFHSHVLFQR